MKSDMLYQIVRAQIEAGKFPVGSALPSEAQLCADYQAARGTVRAALQRLADEGYLSSGQGRQRLVQRRVPLRRERLQLPFAVPPAGRRSPSLGHRLRELGLDPSDIVLQGASRQPAHALSREPRFDEEPRVNEELAISPEAEVLAFCRLRFADGEPLCLQWTVIPGTILSEVPLDSLVPGGLSALYEQHRVIRHRVRASYAPTRASKSEADLLGLTTGAALLEERRVSFRINSRTRAEEPYEYLVSLFTERSSLTAEWVDSRSRSTPSAARKQTASRR